VAAAVVITGWDSGGIDRRYIGSHTAGAFWGALAGGLIGERLEE